MAFPESAVAQAGKYTQIRLIGQGAGGSVYHARDNLGREVAVKEALPARPGYIDALDSFRKEVRLHALLRHPNILQVYHLEEDAQTQALYLICEYADGGSLAAELDAHGPLAAPAAIRVARDICAALGEVWANGIVHRDIKPANILLCKDERGQIVRAKLGDFGVAKDLDRRRAGQPTTQRGSAHPGTPEYMAPEQADLSRPVDVRTDLYALGICLWEMLTGTDYKLLAPAGPPDLRAACPQAGPGLAELIGRAVRDLPAERYQMPQDMAADLQSVLDGRPLMARPTTKLLLPAPLRRRRVGRSWLVTLAALLLLTLAGYWVWARTWFYQREGERPDEASVGQIFTRSQAQGGLAHIQFGTISTAPWPAQAGSVTYKNIVTPQLDHLYLRLRYAKFSPPGVPIRVYLDGEPDPRALLTPLDQGDWDHFAWTEPIDLGPVGLGAHALTLATDGQEYGVADLDAFTLAAMP